MKYKRGSGPTKQLSSILLSPMKTNKSKRFAKCGVISHLASRLLLFVYICKMIADNFFVGPGQSPDYYVNN